MRVAIVGSRGFNDYKKLKSVLDKFHKDNLIDLVVSGGARGADYFGERWAINNKIPIRIFKPEWDKYGKSAGYRRNVDIVTESDFVIAFWDGKSKGTAHSIDIAKQQNKECLIIEFLTN